MAWSTIKVNMLVSLESFMSLTVKDLEKLQLDYPDYQMELVGGEIIVMSPSGLESDEVAIEICRQLGQLRETPSLRKNCWIERRFCPTQ